MWLITAASTVFGNRGNIAHFRVRARSKENAVAKFHDWWGKQYRLVSIRRMRSNEI